MKISKEEVLHVAHLARLDIDETDVDRFAGQIGTILDYVDTLKQVDTAGVPATSHAITLTNAFREDEAQGHLDPQDALANAPEKDDGAFTVPRVI
ncbi:aspartyl/glutamyl-tRNA(Asn/Gln) amidotransferase subunit C [Desulfosarcina alkanivorans]|jgi:aspartyl-tRNA(Asn)/glutamyl-tRNA(Gln) amidotransferase subunit C|uniref:Aspartyl/glutamyl-tRNA(Asn/Gln) amidotransferase subunit C n=1 Tax=Desulfosarcina alkanivorans TaxID=571177 RepID=A0A5K7YTH4_9BACT|nr:Asp-tRNA(Asn)/Glu-tRNA(Gln) amidotransferase subunit GatC [Desulfosarcina alkanivorans]BBO69574.1 aspartyl/glutamyl-tRNA(Asn/Gln) amidotransferase subunit C [Desulfosarcina alkanivorans]